MVVVVVLAVLVEVMVLDVVVMVVAVPCAKEQSKSKQANPFKLICDTCCFRKPSVEEIAAAITAI